MNVFQILGGFDSDVVILLPILFEWDVEALRAALTARKRVLQISSSVGNAPNVKNVFDIFTTMYNREIIYMISLGD